MRDRLADRCQHGDDLAGAQVPTAADHPAQHGAPDEVEDQCLTSVGEGHDRPERDEVVVVDRGEHLLLDQCLLRIDLVAGAVRHLDRHRTPGGVDARPDHGRPARPDDGVEAVTRDVGDVRGLEGQALAGLAGAVGHPPMQPAGARRTSASSTGPLRGSARASRHRRRDGRGR